MESNRNRYFANTAHPMNWYEVAKLMHENANLLHNIPQRYIAYSDGVESTTRPTNNQSVFLLASFALENLIKAFLIYENPHYIAHGKLSCKLLNGYSLTELQGKCKQIPSPKRTRYVFKILEAGINSWARYPCATSVEREAKERVVMAEFWASYNRVFNLYSKRFEQLLSKKWKGPYGWVGHVVYK
jgi:hypothetical protein